MVAKMLRATVLGRT